MYVNNFKCLKMHFFMWKKHYENNVTKISLCPILNFDLPRVTERSQTPSCIYELKALDKTFQMISNLGGVMIWHLVTFDHTPSTVWPTLLIWQTWSYITLPKQCPVYRIWKCWAVSEIRVLRQTDRQTDGQTDRQTGRSYKAAYAT